MYLFQIKFTDSSYAQKKARSFSEIEALYGAENIASIVKLEEVTF